MFTSRFKPKAHLEKGFFIEIRMNTTSLFESEKGGSFPRRINHKMAAKEI
ncbi:hypothetical protein Bca4012_063057 [Brassica carinata]